MYVQKDNPCDIIKKVRIISVRNIFTKNIGTLLIFAVALCYYNGEKRKEHQRKPEGRKDDLSVRALIRGVFQRESDKNPVRDIQKMDMTMILGTVQNREVRKVAG